MLFFEGYKFCFCWYSFFFLVCLFWVGGFWWEVFGVFGGFNRVWGLFDVCVYWLYFLVGFFIVYRGLCMGSLEGILKRYV